MGTKIKIGGIPFEIETVENDLDVCHDGSGHKLWGKSVTQSTRSGF